MSDAPHLEGAGDPPPEGAPGGNNGLVPVNRRIVTWDALGNPVVRDVPMLTRALVSEIAMAAASMPYVDPDDELAISMGLSPSEFYGKTNLEVMLVKRTREAARTGDTDQVEKILDRLVGKPKAVSETHSVTESYEGFLKRTAGAVKRVGPTAPDSVVDAQVVDPVEDAVDSL